MFDRAGERDTPYFSHSHPAAARNLSWPLQRITRATPPCRVIQSASLRPLTTRETCFVSGRPSHRRLPINRRDPSRVTAINTWTVPCGGSPPARASPCNRAARPAWCPHRPYGQPVQGEALVQAAAISKPIYFRTSPPRTCVRNTDTSTGQRLGSFCSVQVRSPGRCYRAPSGGSCVKCSKSGTSPPRATDSSPRPRSAGGTTHVPGQRTQNRGTHEAGLPGLRPRHRLHPLDEVAADYLPPPSTPAAPSSTSPATGG